MNLDPTRTENIVTSALWIIRSTIPNGHEVFSALIPILKEVFPDGWEEWSKDRAKSRHRIPGAIPRPLHMRNGWS